MLPSMAVYRLSSGSTAIIARLVTAVEGHIRVARLLLHKQHASPEALNDLIKHASAKHTSPRCGSC
ncbi:hypothetical protein GQ600_1184 [Phytophthora cactorum]|nr:hypothetical protein GQ600_1184 [Phytophthora cactorum]